MPVVHYTQHAYGSWMPDRGRGYVHHDRGLCPRDEPMGAIYRGKQRHPTGEFAPEVQRAMIDVLIECETPLRIVVYAAGADDQHLHAALGYFDERAWDEVCRSVRQSLSRRLNAAFGSRPWFTKKYDRRPVRYHEHLVHLANEYFPSHRGWRYHRTRGFRPPRSSWPRPHRSQVVRGRGTCDL